MKQLLDIILSLFSQSKRDELKEAKKESTVDKSLLDSRKKEVNPNDPIAYKKNQERLKREYKQLVDENPALYNIIRDLDRYVHKKFNKNIVITMIYRTQAEQDYLYRNSTRYQKRKFKSPHQFWHAVDIRSRTFTRQEINEIVVWLNERNNQMNYYSWTAKCHNVGSGMHFHIQFVRK